MHTTTESALTKQKCNTVPDQTLMHIAHRSEFKCKHLLSLILKETVISFLKLLHHERDKSLKRELLPQVLTEPSWQNSRKTNMTDTNVLEKLVKKEVNS